MGSRLCKVLGRTYDGLKIIPLSLNLGLDSESATAWIRIRIQKNSGSGSELSESGSETLLNVPVKENKSRNCFCSVKILRELTHF
jgi:hypothetical protein